MNCAAMDTTKKKRVLRNTKGGKKYLKMKFAEDGSNNPLIFVEFALRERKTKSVINTGSVT